MHNTGNPLGSTQVLDLYDNSENIDHFANSQLDEHPDRFGVKRLTLAGLIKRSMALRNEINDFSGALTFKPEWSDVPMNVSEGVGGEGGALNVQAEALGNRSEINKVTSREALRRSYAEARHNLVAGSFEIGGTLTSPLDVLFHEATGKAFSWLGDYPVGGHIVAPGTDPAAGGYASLSQVYSWDYQPFTNIVAHGAQAKVGFDNTLAIQAAINTGLRVFIPLGTWETGPLLLDNCAGMFGVGSLFKNTLSILQFKSTSIDTVLLKCGEKTYGMVIEDLYLKGTGVNGPAGQCGFATYMYKKPAGQSNGITIMIDFKRCRFTDWSKAGAYLSDQWFVNFDNCYFVGCGSQALNQMYTGGIVAYPGGGQSGWSGSGTKISSCYFAASAYGLSLHALWNVYFENCIFEWLTTPYYISENCHSVYESNCWYESNTNPPTQNRGGVVINGRDRPKTKVTSSASDLGVIYLSESELSVFRDPAREYVSVKMRDGVRALRSVNANTSPSCLEATTFSQPLSDNTYYPATSLKSHGSYYSTAGHAEVFGGKFCHSAVSVGFRRSAAGAGASIGAISFDVGVVGWPSSGNLEDTNTTIARVWEIVGGVAGASAFRPVTDNLVTIGQPAQRPSVIYAATGTINTSDGREKTAPSPITDAVLDAWGDVQLITFQWLASIREKGEDGARWHFGVIAQQVRDAFAAHHLDGRDYGLLCYDEWDEEWETILEEVNEEVTVINDDGIEVVTTEPKLVDSGEKRLVKAAGNRWGIRADQCLFLEAAYQRRRCDRIEARLSAAGL